MSTTAGPVAGTVPTLLTGLVDDAAIFPPGDAPMDRAVRAHAEHRGAWYSGLVGPFVCSDRRLPELEASLQSAAGSAAEPTEEPESRLPVTVVVTGGAGAVPPAVSWVSGHERLDLVGVEVAVRDDDPVHGVRRIGSAFDDCLPDGVTGYVEMPRIGDQTPTTGWLSALDALAESGHPAKYRTGGSEATDFPAEPELAVAVAAFLDRELAFKATAGLHHAVRHTAADTGFEHHGFLNLILATRAGLDGADVVEVSMLLALHDALAVVERLASLDQDAATATRRWFRSFGSCSIAEPVHDLVELGLLAAPRTGDG